MVGWRTTLWLMFGGAAVLVVPTDSVATTACDSERGPVVQILGSGGPIADDGRASSGYLVWHAGRSRVLVDVGGGVFLRFGEAGARVRDLEFVGLSHMHTDHSADFAALLKSGSFVQRSAPIVVAGPDQREPFPGLREFVNRQLDAQTGAYRYLSDYLDDSGDALRLREVEARDPVTVYASTGDTLTVNALHVPHGIVPALAFRVEVEGSVLVFASDQNGSDERFVEFAQDADVLVMHLVVPEGVSGPASRLHAGPRRIGQIARDANARTLVLSHLMARSLRDIDRNLEHVRDSFDGEIVLAEDLACIPFVAPQSNSGQQ